jgi:nucleoside-diphosphate-sugar epimerase
MKILITGGAGYIGSVLVGRLLNLYKDLGDLNPIEKLTVVDLLAFNQNTMGQYMDDPKFNFIYGDVCDYEIMDPLYEEHDVILPLAGIVGFPACALQPELAWSLNTDVIIDMLQTRRSVKKIVYPCTNSGYGSYPDGRMVTEEDELNPISVYGKSKVATEAEVLRSGGVSLRLATVMGWSPFMRVGLLVNTFCWAASRQRNIVLYEKEARRNYIHVEDVCQAFILALHNYDDMSGQAYNVGLSTANLSKEELARKIAEHTELHIVEAPFMKDPDQRDYVVSNEKIEAMGFAPQWDLDRTIEQLLKFYKSVNEHSGNIYFGTT